MLRWNQGFGRDLARFSPLFFRQVEHHTTLVRDVIDFRGGLLFAHDDPPVVPLLGKLLLAPYRPTAIAFRGGQLLAIRSPTAIAFRGGPLLAS